jgi:hypothetical protein
MLERRLVGNAMNPYNLPLLQTAPSGGELK